MREFIKTSIWSLVVLSPLVIILQYLILKPHLGYAFADVDWMFLLDYKQMNALGLDPVNHFITAWNKWGVYTYQVYYIGLIDKLFGFDYKNFQVVTLIFKVIATISIYPLIYLITKSKLAAFLTALIYAVSYSAAGVMYTVVTSGLFIAIPVMNFFLGWYFYLVTKGRNRLWEILIGVILLITTLLLATERMYPLIPVIFLIELFWWFRGGFSKDSFFKVAKRLFIFFLLFLIGFLYKSSMLIPVSGNAVVTYQKLLMGNWQVLLSPVISLGSLFLPKDLWPILGVPNVNDFFSFIKFFITGPFLLFTFLSIFLSYFISMRKSKFIIITSFLNLIFGIGIYFLSTHYLKIPQEFRMHFDFGYIIPALIGSFVISFAIASFLEWVHGGKKDNLLMSIVGGIAVSFIFIIITWIPADYVLVFFGVHRYLTIPAIGSSLLIAGLITIIFNKFQKSKILRPLAFLIFFLLIPLFTVHSKTVSDHMKYELEFAGTEAKGHIRMKEKLWSFLGNFSKTTPSIFYFDESADHDNGYFDETTVMAGFNYWMQFREGEVPKTRLTHALLRSNLICPEPRSMCLDKVKSLVTVKNGEKGIMYGDIFYNKDSFYAFRFINRDLVGIKEEVMRAIGLE